MTTYCSDKETKAAGCSKIGASHIRNGEPNQDSFLIRLNGCLKVFAVADGLGSHKYSKKGSSAVCRAVWKTFKALSKGEINAAEITAEIENNYRAALKKRHKSRAGTTCIFCAVFDDVLYVGQAGDGVCCINIDGGFKKTAPQGGDFTNEVHALSGDREFNAWKFRQLNISAASTVEIMLTTDGISEDILPDKMQGFMQYVSEKAFAEKRGLKKLLDGWSVPASLDDKTIVIVRYER